VVPAVLILIGLPLAGKTCTPKLAAPDEPELCRPASPPGRGGRAPVPREGWSIWSTHCTLSCVAGWRCLAGPQPAGERHVTTPRVQERRPEGSLRCAKLHGTRTSGPYYPYLQRLLRDIAAKLARPRAPAYGRPISLHARSGANLRVDQFSKASSELSAPARSSSRPGGRPGS